MFPPLKLVETRGIEPLTPALQRCSTASTLPSTCNNVHPARLAGRPQPHSSTAVRVTSGVTLATRSRVRVLAQVGRRDGHARRKGGLGQILDPTPGPPGPAPGGWVNEPHRRPARTARGPAACCARLSRRPLRSSFASCVGGPGGPLASTADADPAGPCSCRSSTSRDSWSVETNPS